MTLSHSTVTDLFTDIAEAIRLKTGGTSSIVADTFPSAINSIQLGVSQEEYNVMKMALMRRKLGNLDAGTGLYLDSSTHVNAGGFACVSQGWLDDIIYLGAYAFAGQSFMSGDFQFTNLKNLASYTFKSLYMSSYALLFPALSYVQAYAFEGASIYDVRLSIATSIYEAAFAQCTHLSTVSMPECTNLSLRAFISCNSLESIYAPKLQQIGLNAFAYCSKLQEMSLSQCTTISGAFGHCSRLTSVNLPVCTGLGSSTFYDCAAIINVSAPQAAFVNASCFTLCTALSQIDLPKCSVIGSSAFYRCSSLQTISIGSSTSDRVTISVSAFYQNHNLLSLYLLGSATEVASLANVNVFMQSPISNSTASTGGVHGSIFVPSSMYNAYIASTNWVTYADRFVSV